MKKHILVVSQYFYPEQFRINDICEQWVKRGYKVTVLTGIPNYPQGKYFEGYGVLKKRKEEYKGINIIRIPLVPRGKNPFMLVSNYLTFVISGWFFAKFTKVKADYVFIYEVSPMTQALPGVWYAKRNKAPCLLYVMDLWPENVEIVAGVKNVKILKAIGKVVDYIYKRCDKILVSSESFIETIENRGVESRKVEFWPQYAEDFYKPFPKENADVKEIPIDDWFNIIFAGNIGYAQGLDVLPKTAALLKKGGNKVRFNLVGDGRAKDDLLRAVDEYEVTGYFNFIDRQPATRIPELMSVCNASLICLSKSKVFEITLPAKTQSYLACGIPIIACADGEVCDVILKADAGVCSPASDAEKLTENIIELINCSRERLSEMGENAINYYNKYFDKNMLLDKIEDIMRQEGDNACV